MDHESSEQQFAAGTIVAGKLRILRQLGAGGMGAVYEVEHEITRHRRALKLLHSQMAQVPSVVERFLREASAAGRIGNPHIVETFDAGRLETGEPYIVMELLVGKTLAQILDEEGPLNLGTTCDILVQACDAVAAAHAVGIVHRDLKPENLFLSGPDRAFVKILDFGISKFDAAATGVEGLTLEGSPIGTPYYMSPEQVQGEKTIDARTDVYALGVLLYECLTGQKPFVADTLPHLIVLIFQGKYAAPSALRPSLPNALDRVVAKAMSSDRNERYATAGELSLALGRLKHSTCPMAMDKTDQPSLVLPTESHRGAPALTPDVFSKPTGLLARSKLPRQSTRWLWPMLGAAGLIALGVGLSRRTVPTETSRAEPAAAGLAGARTTATALTVHIVPDPKSAADPSMKVVHEPKVLPVPHLSASGRSPAVNASPEPGNGSKTSPTASGKASPAKNRASSYGLSEENPFK